jgi:hypothetical protein
VLLNFRGYNPLTWIIDVLIELNCLAVMSCWRLSIGAGPESQVTKFFVAARNLCNIHVAMGLGGMGCHSTYASQSRRDHSGLIFPKEVSASLSARRA